MQEEFMLTPGSKFRVFIGDEDEVEFDGIFRGLCAVGGDTSLVFELDGGTLRFISSSSIVFMDLLEMAEAAHQGKSDPASVYYG